MLAVNWVGGIEGTLFIKSEETVEFRAPWKLIPFIERNKSDFSVDELGVLGVLALFMSICEQWASKDPNIIRSAKKGNDSYGVTALAFNDGIENLAFKLHPVGSEDGNILVVSAFNYVVQDLEALRWTEAAA